MKKIIFIALIIALCSNPTYAQYILHIAGNSTVGDSGDGGPASTASFEALNAICIDHNGNLYIGTNDRVRRIDMTTGIVTYIAGGGGPFDTTDNIPATNANIESGACGVCINSFDGIEYLYIADNHYKVRKVNLATGMITTAAGRGPGGYGGDGGPATAGLLGAPRGVAIDPEGNLYIAEHYNNTIRKVTASTGIITTIAGNNRAGFSGDGGPATAALLDGPEGVALDSHGNVYIADQTNNRIRRIDATTGVITTIAGIGPTGTGSYSGDGGPATIAALYYPARVAFDKYDNMYIADFENNRIRKVDAVSGTITTYAGNGSGVLTGADSVGDGGPATSAEINVYDLCMDSCGNMFFNGQRNVRAVTASGPSLAVCGLASLGVQAGKLTMKELMVWPNPTSGNITIQAPVAGSLVMYNMVGQQVAAYKVASGATDVRLPAALAAGVYMGVYKADDGGAQQMVRVVVSR